MQLYRKTCEIQAVPKFKGKHSILDEIIPIFNTWKAISRHQNLLTALPKVLALQAHINAIRYFRHIRFRTSFYRACKQGSIIINSNPYMVVFL